MNITFEDQHDYVLARVAGSIDNMAISELQDKTQPLVEQRNSDLLIDLSKTDYINSDGLFQFVRLHKMARKKSKRVILFSAAPLVRTVFRVTHLDRLLTIVDDREQALSALSAN